MSDSPRDLDAAIAERLFGWKYIDGIPAYSTTWDGAGLVVEAMRERGWWVTIRHCGNGPGKFGWFVDFTHEPTQYRGRRTDAVADTAPLAIARAALAALDADTAAKDAAGDE